MRVIGLTEFGGPDVLKVFSLPEPEPGAGEVRIHVDAVAVNPIDVAFRAGARADALKGNPTPWIPGMDASGTISAVGPHSSGRLTGGDPVIAYVAPFGPGGGSYAQEIVVDERSVVQAPEGVTPAAASTLLLNAVTADLALEALGLETGQTIVVTGGAGAVGGYATQLAHARGLQVIASASELDEALVRGFGADHVIPRGTELGTAVRRIQPEGAHGVIDAASLNEAAFGALRDGAGLTSLKGWTADAERGIRILPIASFAAATDTARLERLRDLAQKGDLTLRVAEVIPAADAALAHAALERGGIRGRIVLDVASLQGWPTYR